MHPKRVNYSNRISFTASVTAAMVTTTFSVFALGALSPFIMRDLSLSSIKFGLLGTLFFGFAALGSLVCSRLADRMDAAYLLLISIALAAASMASIGISPNYLALAVSMAVGGIVASLANPATNRLVSMHVPRGHQGVVMGVKQSGVQLAVALTGILMPAMALRIGWRPAFIVIATATILVVPIASRILPGSALAWSAQATFVTQKPRAALMTWLGPYAFLMGTGSSAVGLYLVLYSVEELDFSPSVAGIAMALSGSISIASRIVWARAAEQLSSVPAVLAFLSFAAMCAILAVASSSSWNRPWLLWVGSIMFGASATAWNSVGHLAVVRGVEADFTGRASGYLQFAFFSGLLVAPVTIGWLRDYTGSFDIAWLSVAIMFLVATVWASVWTVCDWQTSE